MGFFRIHISGLVSDWNLLVSRLKNHLSSCTELEMGRGKLNMFFLRTVT